MTAAPGPVAPTAARQAWELVRYVWTHPANAGRRSAALLRMARHQAQGRLLGRRTKARLGDHSWLWADLHRTAAALVVYANPPDLPEMNAWRRVLRPGCLFVDVGANVGTYSVWAAERGAEVIALEPAADTFMLLQENIALNGYAVQAIRAAAGASCGTAAFTSGQDAGNRLDPAGSTQIRLLTVDSLIGDRVIDGMKVDVEGFELEVLRGCRRALAEQRIRLMQLEWNAASQFALGVDRQPVADLLASCGYGLYRPDAAGRLMPVDHAHYGPDVFACPA